MTLPRDRQETIRRMHADGASIRQIARATGIARDTVAKYANLVDCSPTMPARRAYASPAMEPYADIVAAWLEGDEDRPRKQRHTAKRIFDRLVDECGYAGSVSTVERFVRNWRRSRPAGRATGFLELEWPPGVCQIDFGHAAAILAGERRELLLLAVSWPACNARYCVACQSHRSESLCEGLTLIFEHVGRVPVKGILDNATEAGRRIAGEVRESELFAAFRAHCAMESDYCNPASGHEKGSVENAVGFLRRNLMVPLPEAESLEELNAWLLSRCDMLLDRPHYRTGEKIADMFKADLAAMRPLPPVRFDAVKWETRRADRDGRVSIDSTRYLAGPAWHGRRLLVGLRASSVEIRDEYGAPIVVLPRSWRPDGKTVADPACLIGPLSARPRAWDASPIRAKIPEALREAVDLADGPGRRAILDAWHQASRAAGYQAATSAAASLAEKNMPITAESVDLLARRMADSDTPTAGIDLAAYDVLAGAGETRKESVR